jgi:macrolide-specific efflux system membrane fusion protein
MKKRSAIIIVVCVVVVGIVLGIVLSRGAGPESTPTTVNVTRGDIVKTVLVDGNLEMPNKAYLSFGVTGTVTKVLVDEGNNVTKGQVLARLDAQSLNSSVEVAELQVKIAEAQVRAARAQYEASSTDITEANWEIAKLTLKIEKLSLESAELNLDKAVIVAPFNGVVADISITEGEGISTAALATPAISLVDTSEIEMQGYIDELDVASVKLAQAANITLDALPNEQVTGSVTFISPISTVRAGIVSYATTITLENPSAELKDGMSATAEVVVERRDNVLLIPNAVIQGTLQNPTVVVLVDGQKEERQITLGLSDGFNTEVLSGLEEGEEVVVPAPTSTQQSSSFFGR